MPDRHRRGGGEEGDVGRSHGIEFTGNLCQVEGSQALLIQWFPDVVVQGNTFDGVFDRAAIFLDGSTGGSSPGNTVPAEVVPYEVDQSSRDGFSGDVGRRRAGQAGGTFGAIISRRTGRGPRRPAR